MDNVLQKNWRGLSALIVYKLLLVNVRISHSYVRVDRQYFSALSC